MFLPSITLATYTQNRTDLILRHDFFTTEVSNSNHIVAVKQSINDLIKTVFGKTKL